MLKFWGGNSEKIPVALIKNQLASMFKICSKDHFVVSENALKCYKKSFRIISQGIKLNIVEFVIVTPDSVIFDFITYKMSQPFLNRQIYRLPRS